MTDHTAPPPDKKARKHSGRGRLDSAQFKRVGGPYLSIQIANQFKRYCKVRNVTESAVIEAALGQYLDDSNDRILLLRRLDRQQRAIGRLTRDLNALTEMIGVFIQLWMAHTPEIPAEQKAAAQQAGLARFHKFLDHVGEGLGQGHRFADDILPDEPLADAGELEQAITKAQGDSR
jgi:hypothetical protein